GKRRRGRRPRARPRARHRWRTDGRGWLQRGRGRAPSTERNAGHGGTHLPHGRTRLPKDQPRGRPEDRQLRRRRDARRLLASGIVNQGGTMLAPSRNTVISVAVAAVVLLALGLATDVGLFGWSLAALLALYLGFVGIARFRAGTG